MTAIYDQIGDGYDLTRRADPYLATRLAHLLEIRRDGRYLDIACGSGNYTTAMAQRGGRWTGLDASELMLEQARDKSQDIDWVCGTAESLPFDAGAFDGAICTLALHHITELDRAFSEARRILAGGSLVIFTSSPEQMRGYWLNEYFPDALAKSIEQMPDPELLRRACLSAGFANVRTEPYFVQNDLQDGFLYAGKHRPEVYLSAKARAGSSTFRNLADPREVEEGCARLREDLATGRHAAVARKYDCPIGDYLFIRATVEE